MLLEVGWADDTFYSMTGGCKYILSARVLTEAERSVTFGCSINIRSNSKGPEIRFFTDGSLAKSSTLTPDMHDWKWITPVISHRGGQRASLSVNLGSTPFKYLDTIGLKGYRGVWGHVQNLRSIASNRPIYRPESCFLTEEVEQVRFHSYFA